MNIYERIKTARVELLEVKSFMKHKGFAPNQWLFCSVWVKQLIMEINKLERKIGKKN